jgi:hypothetical protein
LRENDIKRVTRAGENLWKGTKKIYRGARLAALGEREEDPWLSSSPLSKKL